MGVSSNFAFLVTRDEQFARLGALAERYFFDDAPSSLIQLRQLAEFIAKDVAARHPSVSERHRDQSTVQKLAVWRLRLISPGPPQFC